MSNPQDEPVRSRYLIIANDGQRLQRFIAELQRDKEVQLLDTLGPTNMPHTLICAMTHEKAAALAENFQAEGALRIEPDQPLSLFGSL